MMHILLKGRMKTTKLKLYKLCLGGMVVCLLLTCTLYELRTQALASSSWSPSSLSHQQSTLEGKIRLDSNKKDLFSRKTDKRKSQKLPQVESAQALQKQGEIVSIRTNQHIVQPADENTDREEIDQKLEQTVSEQAGQKPDQTVSEQANQQMMQTAEQQSHHQLLQSGKQPTTKLLIQTDNPISGLRLVHTGKRPSEQTFESSTLKGTFPLSTNVERKSNHRMLSFANSTVYTDLSQRSAQIGAQKATHPSKSSPRVTRSRQHHADKASFICEGDIDRRLLVPRSSAGELKGARCSPHHHVVFLKVHKAASSTVANILQRYGFIRQLTFALPNRPPKSIGYNYISKRGEYMSPTSIIPAPHGRQYDILWNHAIYNRSLFDAFMPADTVYVSILREPFQQFVSAYAFYSSIKTSNVANFKVNPFSSYLHNHSHHRLLDYFRNKQSEDLGMGPQHVLNATLRHQYLLQLNRELHLVMITEFFAESLVLLRRLMCWSVKDVLYISKNKNVHKPSVVFRNEDYQQHRYLSQADYDLYHFFRKKFLWTLAAQGEDFPQEVNHLKDVQRVVQHFCEELPANSQEQFFVPASPWSEAFIVNSQDCQLLSLPELKFLDTLLAARHAQEALIVSK